MGVLNEVKPENVFCFFEEICGIPHGSYQQEEISDYLVSFARKRGLRFRRDEACNVIIWKDASAGYENAAPVILQGHMDMVAVKDEGVQKDMLGEGLELELCGDMIRAKGTSLGGDDGIALAYALAVLDDDSIPHPPLEVVFTANEEVGMLGAAALDVSDLKGRMLLNIDSENEGVFTVSCAGGATVVCTLACETEEMESAALRIRIGGLLGGHSGTEIHKGRANANIVLGRLLSSLLERVSIRLISMDGGENDNAIATSAEALFALKESSVSLAERSLQEFFSDIREEYEQADPDMSLEIEALAPEKRRVFNKESTNRAVILLRFAPDGVDSMDPEMQDMVQTSSNLGVLRTAEKGVILVFLVRSTKDSEKEDLCERIHTVADMLEAEMKIVGGYPGWEYLAQSRLRDEMCSVYRELFGAEPRVEGVHAGLECGIFASKIPGLDAVSFGPQINNIHTTKEALSVSSVQRGWELLLGILRALR